jgi:NADH-quinone oxidoreductase subunit K
MYININSFLLSINAVFLLGLFGIVLNRKNVLIVLISIEIILLSINLNFSILSIYIDDIIGQIFVFFILSIAASESALGLSLITVVDRIKQNISVSFIKKSKI